MILSVLFFDSRNIPVKDPWGPLKYDFPINFCGAHTCKNDVFGRQNASVSGREDLYKPVCRHIVIRILVIVVKSFYCNNLNTLIHLEYSGLN